MICKTTKIVDTKHLLRELPSIQYTDPEYVYIATNNARCATSEIFIKEGDYVKCCQKIGIRHGGYFDQPIHSTVSGTFVGLEKHMHRNGKMVDFIKIQNDHKDVYDESVKTRTDEEIKALTKDDMTELLKEHAMVGLGGSSFPTYIKFQTKDKINTILINGIECEPYITADQRLMFEMPYFVIDGLKIIMQAFDCKHAILCIKKKYPDLIDLYTQLFKQEEGMEVCGVKNFYPQGWENAMIKSALGIEMKPGELPTKYGIINFNVSTVVGIYRAIRLNMPVIERNVSVTGDGIKYPHNFRVRVGTLVKDFIGFCDGYVDDGKPKVFILGGPMMGASLPSDDAVATKTVTSILVFNENNKPEQPCVRCGSCVLSCPKHLEPVQIMNAVKSMDKERVKALNPLNCMECGLCSYSCTSHIRVLDWVRKAKVIAKL